MSDLTIEQFIEQNIKEMEAGNFELVYMRAYQQLSSVAKFTNLLYRAKIDPFEHINFIPREFYARFDVKHFDIPDNVVSIHRAAFSLSSLKSIHIPTNVKIINAKAFIGCYDLKQVTFAEDSKLEEICNSAFQDCIALEEIKLPKNIKTLHLRMFCGCDELKRVTLYNNIENISPEVFSSCPKLTEIVYLGTSDEWSNINIAGSAQDEKTRNQIVIKCTDMNITLS